MATVHVVAHLQAIAGKEAEVKALLLGLIEPTRAEPGCISYKLLESHLNPTEFVFMEEWESREAMNEHLRSAHIDAAFAKAFQSGEELLAAPPRIQHYDLLE
jgi:quinol monooxygenase YgiN